MSLEHELKSVKYAVCKAAGAIMQITREGFKVDRKADIAPSFWILPKAPVVKSEVCCMWQVILVIFRKTKRSV